MDVPLDTTGDIPHFTPALLGASGTDDDTAALIGQKIRIAIGTFRGEVPSDASAGFPYVEVASGSKATSVMRRGMLLLARAACERIPGVRRADLRESFDATTRTLTISGEVILTSDRVIGIEVAPFGVTGTRSPRWS
jgi:hypothetical protein